MKKYVKDNQPFITCCDTKKDADLIHKAIYDETKKDKFLLITSDTDDEAISNVSVSWKDKFVIYSPKVIYGIDFVPETPQPVFVVSRGCTISPLNIAQQVARTRKISELHYYMAEGKEWAKFHSLESVKTYYNHHLNQYRDTFTSFGSLTADDEKLREDDLFTELYLMNENYMDIFRSDKIRHFENIIEDKGFVVKRITRKGSKIEWKTLECEVIRERMEKYIEVVEGRGDAITKKQVEDRFEIAHIKTDDDKKKFAVVLFDNNEFRKHLLVSKCLETEEKVNDRVNENLNHECIWKFLNSDLAQIKVLKNIEKHLGISALFIDDVVESDKVEMKETEFKLILKTFRNRSKVSLPKTKGELLELYCKCVRTMNRDLIIEHEQQDKKGKRTYTYETNDKELYRHLELLRRRNNEFVNIDRATLTQVYDKSYTEIINDLPEWFDDVEEEGAAYDSELDE